MNVMGKLNLDIKRELRYERIITVRESYLYFFDTHIVFHLDFDSDQVENDEEEDEALWRWVPNKTYLMATLMRRHITGVEYSRQKNSWKVVISLTSTQNIEIYLARKADAESLHARIHDFIVRT